MKFYQNIKLSLNALLTNKSRTYFSIAGMTVGIIAMVITVSIGDAAKKKALDLIKSMGTNVIVVNAGKFTEVFGRAREVTNVTTLKVSDVGYLSGYKHIEKISPFVESRLPVRYKDINTSSLIQGVYNDYYKIRNYTLKQGDFFFDINNDFSEKVAVLGSEVADKIFKNENPVNKAIYINKIPFTVIGVLNPIGSTTDIGNLDNIVMVPTKTMMRRVLNIDYISKIYLQVDDIENMFLTEKVIVDQLRIDHKLNDFHEKDDFTIINQIKAIQTSEKTSQTFNLLIMGVAAISLIIGGAGILALMILSVKERIKEIGLRISVGAKKRNIIVQFLSESMIISTCGGGLGILIGCVTSFLIGKYSDWATYVTLQSILISFIFSMATGLIFGVLPARRAASLDPIKALKTE